MIKAQMFSRWPLALLVAALLAACTAPPPKPPKPKPLTSHNEAHPPGDGSGGAPAGGEGAGAAPGSGQGYGAASANAAEVEEEEVAADGTTRVISSTRRAPPAAPSAGGGHAGAGSGAGGAAMPPSATPAHGGQGSGGGGPKGDGRQNGPAYSDMTGIPAEGVADPSADATTEAGKSGSIAPRNLPDSGDSAADRLGVRGGQDESGHTTGAAPAAQAPREREQAPLRENDILAQQLREAAEKEKDPVLRDKLWAEYRKYKAGL